MKTGPVYGYFSNGSKTLVLTKPQYCEVAKDIFKGTVIIISTEGECYLSGAIGASSFTCQYVERKVEC